MVLGGFFSVNRKHALNVGGFSEQFKGYGFTETSLPTKLIGKYHAYVIPVCDDVLLHITPTNEENMRKEKDKLFRKKHDYYFNKYIFYDLDQTIKQDCKNLIS